MKSKNITSIILFILIINTVSALDFLRPDIEVIFDEIVDESTIDVILTDYIGNIIGIKLIAPNNPVFIYKPEEDLEEGFYTVKARAKDMEGTLGPTIRLDFLFQIPPLEINLIEPTLGVSQVTPFNFIISTDRWATCKYAFLDISYEKMSSAFTTTDNLLHSKTDFSTTGRVYIKCKDEFDKITSKTFILAVDSSPPNIIYKHADDVTQFPIETTLIVRTDDETVCKYHMDPDVDYSYMNPFPNYDESKENSYKTEHKQILDSNHLVDYEVNTVYIMCKNKAELLSTKESTDIDVDTSRSPLIKINAPKRYISDTTPLFDVTTNKDSICRLANNSAMNYAITIGGIGREHTRELTYTLSPGTYTYYVECIFAVEGTQQSSVTFTIDDSPPSMNYVDIIDYNGTGKVYKDDELCAKWKAEDNESTISSYAYYIFWDKSTDELIERGTKSPDSDDEYCVDVDLSDSEKYYFTVSAKNVVGLWSSNKTSDSIEVDRSLVPVGCANGKKDGDETDIDCGGDCDCCDNKKSCLLDSDCCDNYCNASNKCAEPECDDGVKNGQETDVDCGGNCKFKCDVGDFCSEDDDCKTDNCDSSTGKCSAVLDTCENNRLDTYETDTDCGGPCPACGIGKSCNKDSDCIPAAKCENGKCKIDSDGDGIIDDKDNCPAKANEDQSDIDNDNLGDECDSDSDNDGLPDSFEQQYFGCITCANTNDDPDKDGLTNKEENDHNTNPTKIDTDGDGYNDKEELDKGTDPLDPSSYPKKKFWKYFFIIFLLIVLVLGGYLGYILLLKGKKLFPPKHPKIPPQPSMRRPMMRRPPLRPIRPRYGIFTPIAKKLQIKKPQIRKTPPTEKPKIPAPKPKEESIFKKLSKIAKKEEVEQVRKRMRSSKLTEKELKERMEKLRKGI